MNDKKQQLQHIIDQLIDTKKVYGVSFSILHKGNQYDLASGNLTIDQPYFIASTTKLFITTLILQLKREGKIKFTDTLPHFFDLDIISQLHVFKGVDYTNSITVQNLLAHTSGLPDYFQQKINNGTSLEVELMNGKDQFWSFEEVLNRTKSMSAPFAPNTAGKAFYSDTNFQLLGKIIEKITDKSLEKNIEEYIIHPLQLQQTYLYSDSSDNKPKHLYYKNNPLEIPKAMTSFWADGGVVSTAPEMLTFIHAFFNGKLFPKEFLTDLYSWNRIFFPMRSGIGVHLFKLPWIFNPFGTVPPLYGHSGLSGALAYSNPEKELYIAGTVNQVAYPETSFKLAIKLINKVQK